MIQDGHGNSPRTVDTGNRSRNRILLTFHAGHTPTWENSWSARSSVEVVSDRMVEGDKVEDITTQIES